MTRLLRPGMAMGDVWAELSRRRLADLPTHGGRTLAYVYDSGLAEVDAIGREAMAQFAATNGLDPTAFPSLTSMEQDLVAWCGRLLHAPHGYAGTATSGGTESILLAVLAARDAHPEIEQPQLVLPVTAHAAFHKAAHYFKVEPVFVDVDPQTYRADPDAMAAAITERTVLVGASAPSYAHGVIDPIEAIAAAAALAGVRCHVDACIGGWVLPWLDEVPPWDFAVPGVTSVSVDLHKYGYAPKGISLLLHRSAELRRSHFFASAHWPGYPLVNTTLQSTKSGAPVAAAWAVAYAIGDVGYARLTRQARDATLALAEAARGIPGLEVAAPPQSTLLALVTDASCDVYTVADEMLARQWFVQPQLPYADLPPTLHLTVSAATGARLDEAIRALTESVEAARRSGPQTADPGLAAQLRQLDPATLDQATLGQLVHAAGLTGEGGELVVPKRMAPVNALLAQAPVAVREAILLAVLDQLVRATV